SGPADLGAAARRPGLVRGVQPGRALARHHRGRVCRLPVLRPAVREAGRDSDLGLAQPAGADHLERAQGSGGGAGVLRRRQDAASSSPDGTVRLWDWQRPESPGRWQAWHSQGNEYAGKGKWKEAAAAFWRAVEQGAEDVSVWRAAALAALAADDPGGFHKV